MQRSHGDGDAIHVRGAWRWQSANGGMDWDTIRRRRHAEREFGGTFSGSGDPRSLRQPVGENSQPLSFCPEP